MNELYFTYDSASSEMNCCIMNDDAEVVYHECVYISGLNNGQVTRNTKSSLRYDAREWASENHIQFYDLELGEMHG